MSQRNITDVKQVEGLTVPTLLTSNAYVLIEYKGVDDKGRWDMSIEIKGFEGEEGYDTMKEIIGAIYRGL